MYVPRIRTLILGLTASLGLAGCATYGDGYGYGGVSLGYGSGGYYDPWYYDYPYGQYGWYDGFYYPGSGYYVYDRGGKRHRWSDHHRRHWEGRRDGRPVRRDLTAEDLRPENLRAEREALRQERRGARQNWGDGRRGEGRRGRGDGRPAGRDLTAQDLRPENLRGERPAFRQSAPQRQVGAAQPRTEMRQSRGNGGGDRAPRQTRESFERPD